MSDGIELDEVGPSLTELRSQAAGPQLYPNGDHDGQHQSNSSESRIVSTNSIGQSADR